MNHWNNKSQNQWTNRQTSKATHQPVHSSNQQINELANHRIQRIWGSEFGKINHCGVFTFSAWCVWCENQVNDQNSTLAGLSLLTIRTVMLAFYIVRWTTKMPFNFQQKVIMARRKGWTWTASFWVENWSNLSNLGYWNVFQWSLTLELLSLAILLNNIFFWEVWRPFNV